MSDKALIEAALNAREQAYAPYSRFRVGAALLTADDKVYTGCNVENASFSMTICAERVAVFKAVSDGKFDFKTIAVAADGEHFCRPCGACLQVLAEFGLDTRVLMANEKGLFEERTLAELLPAAFQLI
ncbi:MAG: cytidine deaminase [Peptococcaceae bacterium]|nr:cytidine deaminase [Peptococcaceae bacterium]